MRDLRLTQGPEATRVVFEFDARIDNNVFTLANPDRVVIDLSHVRRGTNLKLNAAGGVVRGVRSGPHDDGLRVVLDLAAPATPKSFGLQAGGGYGYRLILDLVQETPAHLPGMVTAAAAPAALPAAAPAVPELPPAPALPAAPVVARAEPPPAAVAAPEPAASLPPPARVAVAAPAVAPVPSAAVTAAASASALRLTQKTVVVAVDAGHGGDDPGARGATGLFEKDVTLTIARRLAQRIDAQPGMRAVLTRDGDYYVGLRERTIKARDAQADLFVSIHANSYKDHVMRGTAVYVLSEHGASTEQARWVANHENAADLVGGVDLHDKDDKLAAVLLDISQSATMAASFDLGNRMLQSLQRVNSLQKPQVQQAGFMVLKSPDIPSVLVETAFISNPREERLLRDPAYQDKFADSIFDGIRGYFSRYRPLQQVAVSDIPRKPEVRRRASGLRGATMPVSLSRTDGD